MRKPPKYTHGYIDCRGKPRWYLRRPGLKRVSLTGLPWSPEFMAAYEAAMAGEKIEPGKSAIKPGSGRDSSRFTTKLLPSPRLARCDAADLSRHSGALPRGIW